VSIDNLFGFTVGGTLFGFTAFFVVIAVGGTLFGFTAFFVLIAVFATPLVAVSFAVIHFGEKSSIA
jgi:hypothetical protein